MTIRLTRMRVIGQRTGLRPMMFWLAAPMMAVTLAGCQLATDGPAKQEEKKGENKQVLPTIPTPTVQDLAVDRRQLLLAVNEAASAAATGIDDSSAQASLAGRQFILKFPIGCAGESDAALGWIYDEGSQRLTIKATPDIDLSQIEDLLPLMPNSAPTPDANPVVDNAAAKDGSASKAVDATKALPLPSPAKIEAVDGFWIPRPWILSDVCPVDPITDEAANEDTSTPEEAGKKDEGQRVTSDVDNVPPAPTVGIAHFYTNRDPRTGRRNGQPYRITKRVTEEERPAPQSLRLVLRGRLGMVPGGKVIQCNVSANEERPRCMISATFDRVRFESADGSILYAEWGGG